MSAAVVALRPGAASSEVPAVIGDTVNLMRFAHGLAAAGLVGRHNASRGVLVIEAAPARCPKRGGTGFDEHARCNICDSTGREGCTRG